MNIMLVPDSICPLYIRLTIRHTVLSWNCSL